MKWFLVFWLWTGSNYADGSLITMDRTHREEQRIEMPSQAECEKTKAYLKGVIEAECWAKPEEKNPPLWWGVTTPDM